MRLRRAPSTIYREVKRNFYRDTEIPELNGYHPEVAHTEYKERRAVHRKLIRYPEVRAAVVDRLKKGWSPNRSPVV